ncbi:MAG: LPS assembly lipoprotein LptE [Candidatus Acidiferrales bacterium]
MPADARSLRLLLLRYFCALLIPCVAVISGCGYHVAGRGDHLPSTWQTIAVPAFTNRTSRYRIEQRFTSAVIHEMLARTKYRVIQDDQRADGVLHGEINTIETSPVLFDASTGRVTSMLVTVHASTRLVDRESQKVIYQNKDLVFREEYQISTDVASFFEEQDPALERMSRDFAADLVSNLLENF